MDIRNFFGAKTTAKPKQVDNSKEATKKRGRAKPVVLSDSDEDDVKAPKNPKASKKKPVLSDSDDDFKTSPKKSKKKKENSPQQKIVEEKKQLKSVDAADFFAMSAPPKPKKKQSPKKVLKDEDSSKKRKAEEDMFGDDDDFDAAVMDAMDDDFEEAAKPVKKEVKQETVAKPSPRKKAKFDSPKAEKIGEMVKKEDAPKQTKKDNCMPKNSDDKKREMKEPPSAFTKVKDTNQQSSATTSARKSVVTPIKSEKKQVIEEPTKAVTALAKPASDVQSQLWVDKYKPSNLKGIIGQQGDKSNMNKLKKWFLNWEKHHAGGKKPPSRPPPFAASNDDGGWAKAALLSGPPGVGKTTTSYLVAKDLGYDVMELNASDTRSKRQLQSHLTDAMSSTSLSKTSTKRVILMDEVDGMAGNEDRGGIAELILLIKQSKIPVICMCNDRNHQKIRSLANYCFDLRFQRPRAEQIKGAMMSICFKEKIKIDPAALMELIVGCNQDIRQVLHHLSLMQGNECDKKMTAEEAKKEVEKSKKTSIKIGPWDVTRKVFSASDHQGMSLMDKSDLFFHDYSMGPLFVQENYLLSNPDKANFDKKKTMALTSKAADSICQGDLIEKAIRSGQAWSLLPTQAMFSSVMPGEYMEGGMAGQIQFPQWLGKFSKQNKCDRNLQELEAHMRLSSNLSKTSLNMDFAQILRDAITRPMADRGNDGVSEAIKIMENYALTREDLDNLQEITAWPSSKDPFKSVESKVKAAFTRAYNKDVVLPYAKASNNPFKKVKGGGDTDMLGEDNDDEEEEEVDNDSIEADANIKAKKPSAKSKSTKDSSSSGAASKKGKGRGKNTKK